MNQTAIIILAAGASVRLGRAKQLLPFQNKTLLQRVTAEALNTKDATVLVVTGANEKEILTVLPKTEIGLVHNENWQQGMGSSIKTGMHYLQNLHQSYQSVIICVADQPFVSTTLFSELTEKKRKTSKGIIACAYSGTMGTPVLFDQIYFEQLLMLPVTDGAKTLVKKHQDDVATVPFPLGQIDIDTEEDYNNLLLKQNGGTEQL